MVIVVKKVYLFWVVEGGLLTCGEDMAAAANR